MSSSQSPKAINPLPPVVAALFLVVMGVEVAFWAGSKGMIGGPGAIGWRLAAVQKYACSAEIFQWMLDNNRWVPEHLLRFVSYLFIHANMTHALFGGVLLLAMGKMVGEVFSGLATLLIFVLSGVSGALGFALITGSPVPLVGSYPGVYGLIGAFTFLLWVRLGAVGAPQARAFSLIGILVTIQLVFSLVFGGTPDWVADVAGFVAGFLLSFLLVPGGWRRIREMIRHD